MNDSSRSLVANCPGCDLPVIADEAVHVVFSEGPQGPDWRFSLLTCRECTHPMVIYSENSDDLTEGFIDPHWLYPLGEDEYQVDSIPGELRREINEGKRCFVHGLYTASVVMAGRTLEGLALLHGVREKTLVKSLERLRESGILDGRLVDWAAQLRVMRNEAAHFQGTHVSRQDAADVLALTEAILDYVYVFTKRFEEFTRRRQTDKKSQRSEGAKNEQ
ncbi:DUF4145 domain-containing protein [Streptomyces iconiensis]|uniref:DUF4145 domain-containing protein n=1 Tax=Streptomyces iconiensis TaxID=1384038 RepID=A0ABT6ZR25_9ACTN|nr:DUF4145 domain-containing protein [Streptomyces iconiensis]MDJ1131509.1 DUF4145 domain-containing protein [Streptomyces iconiensis]